MAFHITNCCASSNETSEIYQDDAGWILSSAFLILTMQTGFGMLEAGSVSIKNIANIMIKNCVDVTLGGLTYWMIGYCVSFSESATPFFGYGWKSMFATSPSQEGSGIFYTHYVFQFSLATSATTIVSGAVAERIQLQTYMVFSVLNTFIYCFPAQWAWHHMGFLSKLGFFDFAGGSVVHGTGGASALIAAYMIGPRYKRFDRVNPIDYRIDFIILSVLSGLVSITAGCPVISPIEALIIGAIGALLALSSLNLIELLKIDDPVGAIPVHLVGSTWGVIAVGIFGKDDFGMLGKNVGLLHGGDMHRLELQALDSFLISSWTISTTFVIFFTLNLFGMLRMNLKHELLGADWVEHGLQSETLVIKFKQALEKFNIREDEIGSIIDKMFKETLGRHSSVHHPMGIVVEDLEADSIDQLESKRHTLRINTKVTPMSSPRKLTIVDLERQTGKNYKE